MKFTSFRWTSPQKPSWWCHNYEQTVSGTILVISLC